MISEASFEILKNHLSQISRDEFSKLSQTDFLLFKPLLYTAIVLGRLDFVKVAVEFNLIDSDDYFRVFLIACKNGHLNIVKYFIELGINSTTTFYRKAVNLIESPKLKLYLSSHGFEFLSVSMSERLASVVFYNLTCEAFLGRIDLTKVQSFVVDALNNIQNRE